MGKVLLFASRFALKYSLVFQEKTAVAPTSQTSKDETLLKSALRSDALTRSMLAMSDSRRPLRQTQSLRER